MSALAPPRPASTERGSLAVALAAALGAPGIEVLERHPSGSGGTYPSELVLCRLPSGRELHLWCKHASGPPAGSHGHRGGVAHEAKVYRHVLGPLRVGAPRLLGSHTERGGGTWLFLEHLEGAVRITKSRDPDALLRAARWLADFHASAQAGARHAPFLPRRDASYLSGWARRTARFLAGRPEEPRWLGTLCARFARMAPRLAATRPTVVHGEFYPGNVLVHEGAVRPVDWESAAVGPGELDLASLVEGWPAEIADACVAAYRARRWRAAAPGDFDWALGAARLAMLFRWLGDRAEWALSVPGRAYLDELHRVATAMGAL